MTPACSRCPRARRRSCGSSGGRRSRSRAPAPAHGRRDCATAAHVRWRGRGCPAPTMTVSQHQWIAGSSTPPAPWRKSKSQPSLAWVTCCGEQLGVAARGVGFSGHPRRSAGGRALLPRPEVEAAARDVEHDLVAGLHQGERPADERLGRDVQHAGAVRRAGHAGVADPHHVAHALLQQLLRDREHPPLRHPRAAQRPGVAQHEHGVRVDVQRRVVDARRHVVVVLEDDRPAVC